MSTKTVMSGVLKHREKEDHFCFVYKLEGTYRGKPYLVYQCGNNSWNAYFCDQHGAPCTRYGRPAQGYWYLDTSTLEEWSEEAFRTREAEYEAEQGKHRERVAAFVKGKMGASMYQYSLHPSVSNLVLRVTKAYWVEVAWTTGQMQDLHLRMSSQLAKRSDLAQLASALTQLHDLLQDLEKESKKWVVPVAPVRPRNYGP